MRWPELVDHRHAVLVRAWNSGNTGWFVKRAVKYAEAEPRSIWRGFKGMESTYQTLEWPYCLLEN